MLKKYRYFAILVGQMVVIRRTLQKVKLVKSTLRRPGTSLALVQLAYTGGKVVGTVPYKDVFARTSIRFAEGKTCVEMSRETAMALKPFMYLGD